MSEHTKEPWKIGYSPDQCITVIGTRSDLAWVFNPAAGLKDTSRSHAEDEANARRIVACVNACQGLDTGDLEATGLVSAVGYQLIDLAKQRDRLLAALETLLEHEGTVDHTGIGDFPSMALHAARSQALEVIASVKNK
ncbi:hypothetical protein LCG56_27500 (plasmid) [Pseudomonas cannabina pv. alisalensis]|uniref:Uncharacterized protein n=1 Tax=Pseudomonas syringae pv. maculicola str. ES4326 TaxID=629265 RepID=A0A8T8CAF4_PSEYM|nr:MULTISPECIES: hypothetical protein [Pseudomonas syringae group]QHF00529.1 hypothetical protein PMA4326_028880 [Pseudomonas syringae pv. maculicola str. ES4326]UBZ00509.1 hypothetical protein LCG56_27500 [Pseudomonas cannabina pv. alisalensis]